MSALILLVLFASSRADYVWNNSAGGLYSAPSNWRIVEAGAPIPGQGPPTAGQPTIYNYLESHSCIVDVDIAAETFAARFWSPGTTNVTLDITGPGYTMDYLEIGGSSIGANHLNVNGDNFNPSQAEVRKGSLTLNGTMQSNRIAVGGGISIFPFLGQFPSGMGTLVLNPGADVTTNALWADNAGTGSAIIGHSAQLGEKSRPRLT